MCLDAIRPIAGGVCAVCGESLVAPHVFTTNGSEPVCGLCRRIEQTFAKASAYGSYAGGLRDLIHLLKYQQVRPAANVIVRMLAEVIAGLEPHFTDPGLLVIPVPLYATKQRQRGFNQSEMIAHSALKLCSRKGFHRQLRAEILETKSQIGLSRHHRRENLRGAFRVVKPEEIAGREVLLVDDVFTTGTTVSECARVLRRAGAIRVWVATVARTLKEDAQIAPVEPDPDSVMSMAAHG